MIDLDQLSDKFWIQHTNGANTPYISCRHHSRIFAGVLDRWRLDLSEKATTPKRISQLAALGIELHRDPDSEGRWFGIFEHEQFDDVARIAGALDPEGHRVEFPKPAAIVAPEKPVIEYCRMCGGRLRSPNGHPQCHQTACIEEIDADFKAARKAERQQAANSPRNL